ncbi:histidine kinase [Pigmentiphaga sp. NML080357]|uniref:sensor histidine kinase n=1 Tax=Pigmentiphaga sp. NML080357 TaxID=2008675 RepID=UPI000B40FC21|nr:ATP-binding protein [Pigmentiphaga sp. NML080357]OVZ64971.1 histidine kinase [Pigmentiphaga sp. NML080357]
MNRFLRVLLGVAGVSALLLLFLLAWSTGNSSRLEQQYGLLLGLNAVVALVLFVWVIVLTVRLRSQLRRGQFGAKLTSRFALAFALVGVVPGVLIYMLSVQFLSRSIESWFNVRVDTALESGLSLGRAALDSQLQEMNAKARTMSIELGDTQESNVGLSLTRLREQVGVQDAMVFTASGRVIAWSTNTYGSLVPETPPPQVLRQLKISRSYAAAEANSAASPTTVEGVQGPLGTTRDTPNDGALRLRVIVPIAPMGGFELPGVLPAESRYLQLLQSVPEQIASNAEEVQSGYRDYQELSLSRVGLRKLYGITLTLALLLAVFAAIAAAFSLSSRMVRPLLRLAEGTQAVGVGDYRPIPEPPQSDELGQLTRSFNAMTRQLDEARRMVESNRRQLERSNVYLESILSNLSSGVLVFDEAFRVATVNRGAQQILRVDLRAVAGRPLETVDGLTAFAQTIRTAFAEHAAAGTGRQYWQQQFEIVRPQPVDAAPGAAGGEGNNSDPTADDNTITLLARGSHLPVAGASGGYVVVFDDITEVISANRAVAWGEVARRLAHEIKNPLTPIQLSAERIAIKLADKLAPVDAEMLKRSTTTIINQVSSMQRMVDDFREYARTPQAQHQLLDLNDLVAEVLTLYGWDPAGGVLKAGTGSIALAVELEAELPRVRGDATQLRQVIHNLIANARDAIEEKAKEAARQSGAAVEPGPDDRISVSTRLINTRLPDGREHASIKFMVTDTGTGFASRILQRAFEPYITTKARGTGLGLAIVKKIIEEHGGRIDLANRPEGGAMVSILFTRLAGGTDAAHDAARFSEAAGAQSA